MESLNIFTVINFISILSQLCRCKPIATFNGASSSTECKVKGQTVHHPSDRMLQLQLHDAAGLDLDLLALGDLHLTDERDTNDCPANESQRQNHTEIRGRATCA